MVKRGRESLTKNDKARTGGSLTELTHSQCQNEPRSGSTLETPRETLNVEKRKDGKRGAQWAAASAEMGGETELD